MKKRRILLLIPAAILLCVTACKKYEDGPAFSLRSKSERVENKWKIGQALEDGKDVTADYNKYDLDLTRNGGASLTAEYKIATGTFQYTTNGHWSFVSDKDKISFDFDNDDADGVYIILKLKEKEMWLKEDGGDTELHFVER
jgi:hypothetical protein